MILGSRKRRFRTQEQLKKSAEAVVNRMSQEDLSRALNRLANNHRAYPTEVASEIQRRAARVLMAGSINDCLHSLDLDPMPFGVLYPYLRDAPDPNAGVPLRRIPSKPEYEAETARARVEAKRAKRLALIESRLSGNEQ